MADEEPENTENQEDPAEVDETPTATDPQDPEAAETNSTPASLATEEGAILDVSVDIVAVLGTAELKVSQILQLGRGAVVELDRLVGEPVELRAEQRLVARGEVVVTDDKLAVQITDVIKSRN